MKYRKVIDNYQDQKEDQVVYILLVRNSEIVINGEYLMKLV